LKTHIRLTALNLFESGKPVNFGATILDWVAQTSIKFISQLNLKCKFNSCTFQVDFNVN